MREMEEKVNVGQREAMSKLEEEEDGKEGEEVSIHREEGEGEE
jgi:hypothetical protein